MNTKKHLALLLLCLLPLTGCLQQVTGLVRKAEPMASRMAMIKDAEAGNVEAQYDLGENYCCGNGTLEDNGQALYWWCQAGRQGQADALFQIGNMYANTRQLVGSAVPVDYVKAYAFYILAENGHQKDAHDARKALEHKLSDIDRMKADEMVRKWPDKSVACELPQTLKPKPDPTLMIRDSKQRNTI